MGLIEIIIVAVGLSMDAFAVSVTLGLSAKKPTLKEYVLPGVYFGVFQALMPLIGYMVGTNFTHLVQGSDHWVAFILLGLIGGKMIKESFSSDEEMEHRHSFRFVKMLVLAIATSIDALAVGITFAFFEVNILKTILIIGSTTLIISICGVKIGNIFGAKFKSKAEFAGGAILILIGVKILIEHLFL